MAMQGDHDKRDPHGAETNPTAAAHGGHGVSEDVLKVLRALGGAGGLPVMFTQAAATPVDTHARLKAKARLSVLFPPCTDELLALVNTDERDEVTGLFREYFKFARHRTFGQTPQLTDLDPQVASVIDKNLNGCLSASDIIILLNAATKSKSFDAPAAFWPSECCVCTPCVTLDGNRNPAPPFDAPPNPVPSGLTRLFVADAVWLFWMGERLGIFQILGAILDAYALNGSIPISNGSLDEASVRDDVTAVVLEVMVRQMKQGLASGVRDRAALYRTSLGWNSPLGQKLKLQTQVNTAFNTQFHKFIYHALEFYRDRRMAVAIRGQASPAPPPSVATLITIADTIDVLKKRFEAWQYGRNMHHTLNGIVWTIAGMAVVRELRTTLGIPPAYKDPHEYIPAAYDLLVAKRPITQGEANRFVLHRELARNGRDLLLDLETIDPQKRDPGGELDSWLTQIESKVEAYRTAYRTLTSVDLGSGGSPAIEQQA